MHLTCNGRPAGHPSRIASTCSVYTLSTLKVANVAARIATLFGCASMNSSDGAHCHGNSNKHIFTLILAFKYSDFKIYVAFKSKDFCF